MFRQTGAKAYDCISQGRQIFKIFAVTHSTLEAALKLIVRTITVNPRYNKVIGTEKWLRYKRYFVKSGYVLLSIGKWRP